MKQNSLKGWFKSGAPGVWISGGAVSLAVIMTIGLLAVIAVRGLGLARLRLDLGMRAARGAGA